MRRFFNRTRPPAYLDPATPCATGLRVMIEPENTKAGPEFLLVLLDESERLSAPLREWLETGIANWLKGTSLDDALGLSCQPGQRRPATKIRVALRDCELRRAWDLLDAPTGWKKSLRLAECVSRLEPVYRGYKSGRPPASEINQRLCAARDWCRLPTAANRIHEICSMS